MHSLFGKLVRRCPGWAYARLARLSREQGFDRPYLVLSFDCDTDRDTAVARDLHLRLQDMRITPVYAVPGKLLESGEQVYARLAEAGADFINHGYREHSRYDSLRQQYESLVSYDKLLVEAVVEDITLGQQAIRTVVGRAPTGFRTPHFATFQTGTQLRFLHRTLRQMGYLYSSSTVPLFSYLHGPLWEVHSGFYEIPLTGCFDYPLTVLDSYGFRVAADRVFSEKQYLEQFRKVIRSVAEEGRVGLINVYADPSQVHDWPDFFEAMRLASSLTVCTTYAKLVTLPFRKCV